MGVLRYEEEEISALMCPEDCGAGYAPRPPREFVHEAVRRATAAGVLVVAIGGNDAAEFGPIARWTEILAVGAVNRDRELTEFSNAGDELDFVSVGVDVLSLVPGGSHRNCFGTSFAAPRVAGVATRQC